MVQAVKWLNVLWGIVFLSSKCLIMENCFLNIFPTLLYCLRVSMFMANYSVFLLILKKTKVLHCVYRQYGLFYPRCRFQRMRSRNYELVYKASWRLGAGRVLLFFQFNPLSAPISCHALWICSSTWMYLLWSWSGGWLFKRYINKNEYNQE